MKNGSASHPPLAANQHLDSLRGARVLVTGGAGFVGSNVSRRLVEVGAEVIALDDLSTGKRELLPVGIADFVQGSVANIEQVRRSMAGTSYVFHLAVQNIILSTVQVLTDYSVNIGGTLNVLMAAREMSPPPRIVYASSTSVYGNPKSLPISEDEGINILSPYAASKLAGESYCQAFYEMYQLPVSIVRYSNIYGINQSPLNPYCGVVARFFAACNEGRSMQIHGTGLQTRDFTYIEDAVDATLLAAVHPRAVGEVFNVGSGCETSVRDLASLIAETVGLGCKIEFIDRRDIDNVQRRVMNIERARRILRWVPNTPLDKGLRLTQEWFLHYRATLANRSICVT
jgi:UDP-glucose 4-epimerase